MAPEAGPGPGSMAAQQQARGQRREQRHPPRQQRPQERWQQADAALASGSGGAPPAAAAAVSSGAARRRSVPLDQIPLDLLVVSPSARSLPAAALSSGASVRRANRDGAWAARRDYLITAAAAGVQIAAFAYNLAFWGFEGTAPDRYWPLNPRHRLQIRPGRYGNLEGTKSVYYNYLFKAEGGK